MPSFSLNICILNYTLESYSRTFLAVFSSVPGGVGIIEKKPKKSEVFIDNEKKSSKKSTV